MDNADTINITINPPKAESVQDLVGSLEAQIEQLSNPACSGDTGDAVNEAGWYLSDKLTEMGGINGRQFNNLKPIFCEAVRLYASKLNKRGE